MSISLSRRSFLKTAAAASTTFSLMPSSVLGANEKVNVAFIGIGNRGESIAKSIANTKLANVVALCDVNMGCKKSDKIREAYSDVPKFIDFRKMFDKMSSRIDAVTVSTPDHSHFPISMRAMAEGKHVYVEKPLAHTFHECELMMAAEKKYGVQCQMGNQGHSGANYFQFKSWVDAGIIKDVTHVDAHMNKSRRWHPWGDLDSYEAMEVPKTLDWDRWLTTAPYHPYNEKLAGGDWRSWYDYGNGAFGDWGPHTLDTVHRFLKLGLPETIEAVNLIGHKKLIFPMGSTIKFDFPERGPGMPAMDITWYDGIKNKPPRPKELDARSKISSCGKIIYSKDLVFKGGTHSGTLRIIPNDKMRQLQKAGKLPIVMGKHSDHFKNFMIACKGEEKTRSSFDISAPLTQVFMLGVIAQRLGGKLKFDRKTKQITNNKIANQLLVGPPPRKGWEEYYKL